jgi:hypothetical protein
MLSRRPCPGATHRRTVGKKDGLLGLAAFCSRGLAVFEGRRRARAHRDRSKRPLRGKKAVRPPTGVVPCPPALTSNGQTSGPRAPANSKPVRFTARRRTLTDSPGATPAGGRGTLSALEHVDLSEQPREAAPPRPLRLPTGRRGGTLGTIDLLGAAVDDHVWCHRGTIRGHDFDPNQAAACGADGRGQLAQHFWLVGDLGPNPSRQGGER